MPSKLNDVLARNDIIHALAFAAYLYTRIADETRASSLAVSRYATETAGARTTIATEVVGTRDARLAVNYDDTPNASGKELIDQAWEVDKAIITTLKAVNAPAYKSIVDGMIAAKHRLDGMLNDVDAEANAWQCCVCQRLFMEKQEECPCGASYVALRPVWKSDKGKWYGYC